MNAKIDIKTPAGQSLEGFPMHVEESSSRDIEFAISNSKVFVTDAITGREGYKFNPELHPGDIITIEILS